MLCCCCCCCWCHDSVTLRLGGVYASTRCNGKSQSQPGCGSRLFPWRQSWVVIGGHLKLLHSDVYNCWDSGFCFVSACSDTDAEGKICCTEQRVTRPPLLLPITAFNVHFKGWIKGCRAQGVNAEAWHFVFCLHSYVSPLWHGWKRVFGQLGKYLPTRKINFHLTSILQEWQIKTDDASWHVGV